MDPVKYAALMVTVFSLGKKVEELREGHEKDKKVIDEEKSKRMKKDK
jgi:hypothetical protein